MRGKARDTLGKHVVSTVSGQLGIVVDYDIDWWVLLKVQWIGELTGEPAQWVDSRDLRFASPLEVLATTAD